MEKFNQRWKIKLENSYQKEFDNFKNRILNIFEYIDKYLPSESIELFCQFLGVKSKRINNGNLLDDWHGDTVISELKRENEELNFYKLLELIFSLKINSYAEYGGRTTYSKDILYKKVKQAIEFSNVNLTIKKLEKGEIIFYPKGEEILDNELVNKVLEFLDEKSNKHFVDALKFYQQKDHINSAEQLRRTLEEFLRFKLSNKKGLDQNKTEIGKILKTNKAAAQIRNIIAQIFGYLDLYFNENTKHNDGELEEYDNEFLIYQVGLLLRYINQIIS